MKRNLSKSGCLLQTQSALCQSGVLSLFSHIAVKNQTPSRVSAPRSQRFRSAESPIKGWVKFCWTEPLASQFFFFSDYSSMINALILLYNRWLFSMGCTCMATIHNILSRLFFCYQGHNSQAQTPRRRPADQTTGLFPPRRSKEGLRICRSRCLSKSPACTFVLGKYFPV